jgi:uncharacterized protein (DUF1015 family)
VQTHSPSSHGSGVVLAPFRGLRYDPVRVSELADVTSPPYDVIGPGTLDELLAASPYNVVRLILPALSLDARAAGAVAAERLESWLSSGVLVPDPEPALYVYEQRGPGFIQRGLIGLVGVGIPGILPHEGVMPGPVAGRRELMMATRANLEPILLVYNGGAHGTDSLAALDRGGGGDRDLDRDRGGAHASGTGGHGGSAGPASMLTDLVAEQRPPLVSAVTSDGVTHRLWRLTDPAEQEAIAADLAGRTALIADGHHRYAAYRELRDAMRGAGGGDAAGRDAAGRDAAGRDAEGGDAEGTAPWDYGLAYLVDADAYPPRLGAIHRVIPRLAPDEAARLAAEAFTVRDVPGGLEPALARLAEAGRDGTAFLLGGRPGFWLLTEPDRDELAAVMPADASPRWRALDAAVMQQLLLERLWSIKDNERDVLISHDAREAVRMAVDADGTAVICNPMPLAAVRELAAHGERVPRKSTSFGPKPRTGLVLRTFGP